MGLKEKQSLFRASSQSGKLLIWTVAMSWPYESREGSMAVLRRREKAGKPGSLLEQLLSGHLVVIAGDMLCAKFRDLSEPYCVTFKNPSEVTPV